MPQVVIMITMRALSGKTGVSNEVGISGYQQTPEQSANVGLKSPAAAHASTMVKDHR